MKLFLAFLQSPKNHPIPAYSFWQYYIKNGIEEAGYSWCECEDVDWAYGLVPQEQKEFNEWKSAAWEKTLDSIRRDPPDLFLSYLYPHQIDTDSISSIRKLGVPCVNFFCDNVREFSKIPAEYSAFDLNWVPEFKALEMYTKRKYPFIHLPMPMWVDQKYRIPSLAENDSLVFIGSYDIQRHLLLEEILEKLNEPVIEIYGRGWQKENSSAVNAKPPYTFSDKITAQFNFISRFGAKAYLRKINQRKFEPGFSSLLVRSIKPPPDFDLYADLTRNSMITIGINRYPDYSYPLNSPPSYSRLRDIEAPMLGACYLTEYTPGIEHLYDLESEILTYRDADEFIVQSDKLKNSKQFRFDLRNNGQARALADHSIPRSLQKIKEKLFK